MRLGQISKLCRLEVVVRSLTVLVVSSWAIAVLLAMASPGTSATGLAVEAASWTTVVFAAAAFAGVFRKTTGALRRFWSLLTCGLLLKMMGDASREEFGLLREAGLHGVTLQDAAYALSFVLLFAALLCLVSATLRSITLVSVIDAASIMLSVGLLVWYFILDPAAASISFGGWREALVAFTQPVGNAALLYLCFVVVAANRKPAFSLALTGAFLLFLVADGLHLRLGADGWPQIVGTLGVGLFGLAALRSTPSRLQEPQPESRLVVSPLGAVSFWVSPLSPSLHYGFLLGWGRSPVLCRTTCSPEARCLWSLSP